MTDIFRFFVRKNFTEVSEQMDNVSIDELGIKFHEYLEIKLSPEAKALILPKNSMEVILQQGNPLKVNGFHPAYAIHFAEWIDFMKESA